MDANNNDTVRYVMHELLHVVLSELILGKFDYSCEEAFVLGMENYMWSFISSSKSRMARWQKLIEKKLAENPKPDVPLEDLADRSADEQK